MQTPVLSQVFNPITGVFGSGQVRIFTASGTWTVPQGVGKVRVRMWGGGGGFWPNVSQTSASGGGFALRAIYDLTGVTSVAVTVGAGGGSGTIGGTSSFGSYVSATGGQSGAASAVITPGTGVGGDINTSGGSGVVANQAGGGGAGNLFGNGGNGSSTAAGGNGASGGGSYSTANNTYTTGGNGIFGQGAGPSTVLTSGGYTPAPPTSGQEGQFSIDFIGTGGGGNFNNSLSVGFGGFNGGGGGYLQPGGYPGGGCGNGGSAVSGNGMVIVEW